MAQETTPHRLMKPGEVAREFRVDIKTVNRWADAGKLTVHRTPGGHRRYVREEIESLLQPQAVRNA